MTLPFLKSTPRPDHIRWPPASWMIKWQFGRLVLDFHTTPHFAVKFKNIERAFPPYVYSDGGARYLFEKKLTILTMFISWRTPTSRGNALKLFWEIRVSSRRQNNAFSFCLFSAHFLTLLQNFLQSLYGRKEGIFLNSDLECVFFFVCVWFRDRRHLSRELPLRVQRKAKTVQICVKCRDSFGFVIFPSKSKRCQNNIPSHSQASQN